MTRTANITAAAPSTEIRVRALVDGKSSTLTFVRLSRGRYGFKFKGYTFVVRRSRGETVEIGLTSFRRVTVPTGQWIVDCYYAERGIEQPRWTLDCTVARGATPAAAYRRAVNVLGY